MSKVEKRNFKLKTHLACGNDDLRPIMSHVYFDNGFMYATDGYVVVKAAVQHFSDFDKSEVDILNGKFLHGSTFRKVFSCDQVIITETGIQDLATKDVYAFAVPDVKFPNIEAVIPKETMKIDEIGIQPSVAIKLLKILNTNDLRTVKFEFTGVNRGIKISGVG